MTTEEQRAMVAAAAPSARAIWPNGLAYDWRGWTCGPTHRDQWCAYRLSKDGPVGLGATPSEAKADALRQGRA